jgi:hypothetical protein
MQDEYVRELEQITVCLNEVHEHAGKSRALFQTMINQLLQA